MSLIAAKSVRNKLLAAITEYGLKRTYTPIGNKTADALMVLIMDQIDRESECVQVPENDAVVESNDNAVASAEPVDVPAEEIPSVQEDADAVNPTSISDNTSISEPQESLLHGAFAAGQCQKAKKQRRNLKKRKHRGR